MASREFGRYILNDKVDPEAKFKGYTHQVIDKTPRGGGGPKVASNFSSELAAMSYIELCIEADLELAVETAAS